MKYVMLRIAVIILEIIAYLQLAFGIFFLVAYFLLTTQNFTTDISIINYLIYSFGIFLVLILALTFIFNLAFVQFIKMSIETYENTVYLKNKAIGLI